MSTSSSPRAHDDVDDLLRQHLPLLWCTIFRVTGDSDASDVLTLRILTDAGPGLGARAGDHLDRKRLLDAAHRAAAEWNGRRDGMGSIRRSGDRRLEVCECCERLERTLASEPPAVRDAMLLVYVSHRSYREVAEDLGTSVADVRHRIDRGLARLVALARGDSD